MEACTKRMKEETKGLVQKNNKGATEDLFIFRSCFPTRSLDEAVIDVCADMISIVKKRNGFYKDTINNLTKDWFVGSYLVLERKSTLTWDRQLIAIGYKYNYQ